MDGGINSHVPDDRLKKILDELFIRAKLSKREKFILEQHFYNEYRFFEIAKMMNISYTSLWEAEDSVFPYFFVFLTCVLHTRKLRKLCFSMPLKS